MFEAMIVAVLKVDIMFKPILGRMRSDIGSYRLLVVHSVWVCVLEMRSRSQYAPQDLDVHLY